MYERYDIGGAERGQHKKTGQLGGIRSSAIPATTYDGTTKGRRRRTFRHNKTGNT